LTCPNCGTSNLDTASICANCGRPLATTTPHSYTPPPPPSGQTSYTPPRPLGGGSFGAPPTAEVIPNYLIQSIILTLCCCLPLGIVAIVFSAQVNSKLAVGDIAGAREASAKAKMFCWIGLGLGIAFAILWMVFGGMAFVQGVRDGMANR
jgi:hypothetical protein